MSHAVGKDWALLGQGRTLTRPGAAGREVKAQAPLSAHILRVASQERQQDEPVTQWRSRLPPGSLPCYSSNTRLAPGWLWVWECQLLSTRWPWAVRCFSFLCWDKGSPGYGKWSWGTVSSPPTQSQLPEASETVVLIAAPHPLKNFRSCRVKIIPRETLMIWFNYVGDWRSLTHGENLGILKEIITAWPSNGVLETLLCSGYHIGVVNSLKLYFLQESFFLSENKSICSKNVMSSWYSWYPKRGCLTKWRAGLHRFESVFCPFLAFTWFLFLSVYLSVKWGCNRAYLIGSFGGINEFTFLKL